MPRIFFPAPTPENNALLPNSGYSRKLQLAAASRSYLERSALQHAGGTPPTGVPRPHPRSDGDNDGESTTGEEIESSPDLLKLGNPILAAPATDAEPSSTSERVDNNTPRRSQQTIGSTPTTPTSSSPNADRAALLRGGRGTPTKLESPKPAQRTQDGHEHIAEQQQLRSREYPSPSLDSMFSVVFVAQQLGLTLATAEAADDSDGGRDDKKSSVVVVCQLDPVAATPDSPLTKLRVGDCVVAIGEVSTAGLGLEEIERRIVRGPRPLTMSFRRGGGGYGSGTESSTPCRKIGIATPTLWKRPLGGLEQVSRVCLLDVISDIATQEDSIPESQLRLHASPVGVQDNEDRQKASRSRSNTLEIAMDGIENSGGSAMVLGADARNARGQRAGGCAQVAVADQNARCSAPVSGAAEKYTTGTPTQLSASTCDERAQQKQAITITTGDHHGSLLSRGRISGPTAPIAKRYPPTEEGSSRTEDQDASPTLHSRVALSSSCCGAVEQEPCSSPSTAFGLGGMNTQNITPRRDDADGRTSLVPPPLLLPVDTVGSKRGPPSQDALPVAFDGSVAILGGAGSAENSPARPSGGAARGRTSTKRPKIAKKKKTAAGDDSSGVTPTSAKQKRAVVEAPTSAEVMLILRKLGIKGVSELTLYKDLTVDELAQLYRYVGLNVSKRLPKAVMAERLNALCAETGALADERRRCLATGGSGGGHSGAVVARELATENSITAELLLAHARAEPPAETAIRYPVVHAAACASIASTPAQNAPLLSQPHQHPLPCFFSPPPSRLALLPPSSPTSSLAKVASIAHRTITDKATADLPPRTTATSPPSPPPPLPPPPLLPPLFLGGGDFSSDDLRLAAGKESANPAEIMAHSSAATATALLDTTTTRLPWQHQQQQQRHATSSAAEATTSATRNDAWEAGAGAEWSDWNFNEHARAAPTAPAVTAAANKREHSRTTDTNGSYAGNADHSDGDDEEEASWWQIHGSDDDWSACSSPPLSPRQRRRRRQSARDSQEKMNVGEDVNWRHLRRNPLLPPPAVASAASASLFGMNSSSLSAAVAVASWPSSSLSEAAGSGGFSLRSRGDYW